MLLVTLRARRRRWSSSSNSCRKMPSASPPVPRLRQASLRRRSRRSSPPISTRPISRFTRRASICAFARAAGATCRPSNQPRARPSLLERFEWEREISGRAPDLDGAQGHRARAAAHARGPRVASAGVRDPHQAQDLSDRARRFRNRSRHRSRRDRHAGRSTRPVSELELELKRGDKKALFRLARRSRRRRAAQARGEDQGRARL